MKINLLKLSFICGETIPDLQNGEPRSMALADFIAQPGYEALIDSIIQKQPAPLGLGPPWPYPVGHHFWDHYLYEKAAGSADGALCFRKLAPLRLKLGYLDHAPIQDLALGETARILAEAFYYPFGVWLLLTVTLEGDFEIARAGDLALAFRYDAVYASDAPAPGNAPAAPLTLSQLATRTLDRTREQGFGSGISGARSEFFTIATVVRGDGVDPAAPLTPDSAEHRFLNGLASWINGWSLLPAQKLEIGKNQLKVKKSAPWPSSVIFAAKRGRTVWLPALFLPALKGLKKLSCYHRNLAFASMQTESLIGLAAAIQTQRREGTPVSASMALFGDLAAELLTGLYAASNTYQSDSVRAQIAQSAQFVDVNALCHGLPVLPLATPPP